jgi:hypothetical protein
LSAPCSVVPCGPSKCHEFSNTGGGDTDIQCVFCGQLWHGKCVFETLVLTEEDPDLDMWSHSPHWCCPTCLLREDSPWDDEL